MTASLALREKTYRTYLEIFGNTHPVRLRRHISRAFPRESPIPLKPRAESGMHMGLLSGGILFAQLQLRRDRFDPPDVRCGLAAGMLEV
jgi:hypothetical protein